MRTETLVYQTDHHDVSLQGFLAYDEKISGPRPVVLVAHDWSGCHDFAKEKACELAKLGYLGFAMDLYGEGKVGHTNEEKAALMQPLIDQRDSLLQGRLLAALKKAKTLELADQHAIAAIGFCFGGLCVLDLARTGADINAVVSLHGLFIPPIQPIKPISAKILALHGFEDPMAPPEQAMAFAREMTQASADWQLHIYGNTQHAFTNPQAKDKVLGTVYNAVSAGRAWQTTTAFLQSCFCTQSP